VFVDIPQDPKNPFYGRQERVTGTCHLTAVYEPWKWLLCKSNFAGISIGPADRYRVPGPIVSPAEAARWPRLPL
jgi:hypothetical protein